MASSSRHEIFGYEDSRFEQDVDENFHCSICYNVLREPRTCKNNEHTFCLACIAEHLRVNSQTCPECNEQLSADTLRRPRVLNNYLSKLKINCDHASRGCQEFTAVEDLKTHVENCGFAPVLCPKENCGLVINKQDRVYHETFLCGQPVQKVAERPEEVFELKCKFEVDEKESKGNNDKMKQEQDKLKKEVEGVKKEVKDIKGNLVNLNNDMEKVKVMMSQMLEKLNLLEQSQKRPSLSDESSIGPRKDILIAGGYGRKTAKSTMVFSWERNGWFQALPMNHEHIRASSFIYNDLLFVVGGVGSKKIETLDLNELPLKWMEFPGELPFKCDDHQTVVYQQRVIHIGGYNYGQRRRSNLINELQLASPCIVEELCEMPEPRVGHCAEIFEDKILIFGGEGDRGAYRSVLEFDPRENECKEMPPLPRPLTRMATVRWEDQVVVLGGCDKDGEVQNDAFMYDCKTGRITVLPPMLEKRYGCCAVAVGNTIVVMGGENIDENARTLNTMEGFTVGSSTWKQLPVMNEAKFSAIAEVLPSARKCV